MQKIALFSMVLFSFIFGSQCTTGKNKSENRQKAEALDSTEGMLTGAHIRIEWQKRFIELVQAVKIKEQQEGWALFTYGGWSDNGQVMVVGAKEAQISYAKPNSEVVSTIAPFDKAKFESFKSKTESFKTLGDKKATAFDALQYEYVHVVMKEGKLVVDKRVFIEYLSHDNPQKEDQPYRDLVALFEGLMPKS